MRKRKNFPTVQLHYVKVFPVNKHEYKVRNIKFSLPDVLSK